MLLVSLSLSKDIQAFNTFKMKLQAFILIATIFKIISAKSLQTETFQCNIPEGKEFDSCEFSHVNYTCISTQEKSVNEDCPENHFQVDKSDKGCNFTIQNLKPDLFGTWTCKLYSDNSDSEVNYGDPNVIFEEEFQAGALLSLLSNKKISTIVWIVVPGILVIGVISFFILKKKGCNKNIYKL